MPDRDEPGKAPAGEADPRDLDEHGQLPEPAGHGDGPASDGSARRLFLVAVRHPGEIDGASVEESAPVRPDGPGRIVRPAVVAVWRADGGDIGV